MEVEQRLIEAIAGRRVVRLSYANSGAQRVGHPHVLYRGADGTLLVDVYQVAGYSSSGRLPQWRMFEVAAIARVEVQQERFEPASDYNPGNARFARIIAAV